MELIANRVGETSYNNQGEKMIIIAYRNSNDIDVQFEDGIIVYNRRYGNFIRGRIKHPIRYEESFAYHIEVELGIDLDDIWNWEKNNELGINPYEITKQSNKKVWLYCQENDYHNYNREGNKIGYEISCNSFMSGQRCGYCGSHKVHWKDSLAYNYPQIAKMIAIEENNLTFENCYNIACFSGKKFYFKCLNCKSISTSKISLNKITRQEYACEFCSDGISVPNKFMANVLKQLNKKYIIELSKKDFEWCGYFRYDFYIPSLNIIIEVNGLQHYEECALIQRTLEQEQMNDLFKYKCAKGHVDKYIVIDCRYSELKWMKENIIKELNKYFNLSNIDWELAWEESQSSLCVKAWELWNSGYGVMEIAKELNLTKSTVRKYLKRGYECGKCDYTVEISRKRRGLRELGKNNINAKSVICITTNKIFLSINDGAKYYNCISGNIIKCCKKERGYCGKLKDGTELIWRYIIWNHNKIYKVIR